MSDCCSGTRCALDVTQSRQRTTLRIVLGINAAMFAALVGAALYAGSSALLSNSLDDLGDALTYGLSLWAVGRGTTTKARVALFKGGLIFAAACVVVVQIAVKLAYPHTPPADVMAGFAVLALVANSLCLALLWRHRHEDLNMSSVWECSRNDVATNLAVILAAVGVWLADGQWPDILIAGLLVVILLRSSARVIGQAWGELKHPHRA